MPMQSPAYKNHLRNLQNEIDAEKLHELQKLNLFNEKTFYRAFIQDMLEAEKEVIIYSPFISKFRSEFFSDTLRKLRKRNIAVFIFTRPLEEHDHFMRSEISCALKDYEEMGADIFYLSGSIHEKVAIIDRRILWEGSLNILSQRTSKEMMRRIHDEKETMQVMSYLELSKKLAEGYKNKYERLYRNLVVNKKDDYRLKVKVCFAGAIVPILGWLFFSGIKIITLSLKSVKVLMDLVKLFI